MGSAIEFNYYYGAEAEQFSFYRVPRMLIKDARFKRLSSDAKLLYGLMLDRMALSVKNGWFDEKNRAYVIYTIDNIREDLGCSKEKAVKVLAELDAERGIGLVEKKRRGLGKPDIIYVKNFVLQETTQEDEEKEPDNTDVFTEVGKTDFRRSGKPTSGGQKNRLQEVGETDPSYNNNNYTELNYINPINQSDKGVYRTEHSPDDMMDADINVYIDIIKENIEYDECMASGAWPNRELYNELFDLICEVVCVKRKTLKLNGEEYPYELVKSRFLKLNRAHLEYVIDSLGHSSSKVTNIRSYLITALYNAPSTIHHSIRQEVQHDMYGGGWKEKGIV